VFLAGLLTVELNRKGTAGYMLHQVTHTLAYS